MSSNKTIATVVLGMVMLAALAVAAILTADNRSPNVPAAITPTESPSSPPPPIAEVAESEEHATRQAQGLDKLLAYELKGHGFGSVSACVHTAPLTEAEYMSIAEYLLEQMTERYHVWVARMWFYYTRDQYDHRLGGGFQPYPAAYYQVAFEKGVMKPINVGAGFFTDSLDPGVMVRQWSARHGGYPYYDDVTYEASTGYVTLTRLLLPPDDADRGDRWYKFMQGIEAVFGEAGIESLWSCIPGMKGIAATFLDKEGERIAEIRGDRRAHNLFSLTYENRYKDFVAIDDEGFELDGKYRAGILTRASLEQEERLIKLRKIGWYEGIWTSCAQAFRVDFVREDWRLR